MGGQTYGPMDGQEGRQTDRQTDCRYFHCIQKASGVYSRLSNTRGHKIPSEHSMIKICSIKHNHSHKTAPSGFIDHVTIKHTGIQTTSAAHKISISKHSAKTLIHGCHFHTTVTMSPRRKQQLSYWPQWHMRYYFYDFFRGTENLSLTLSLGISFWLKDIWAATWDFQQCGLCDQQSLRSLIRAFANRLHILWVLCHWLSIIWSF